MPSPSRYYSSTAAKTTLLNSISNVSSSLELAAASNLPSQYPYTLILEKDTASKPVGHPEISQIQSPDEISPERLAGPCGASIVTL
jgi:hypothetical protein